MEKQQKILQMAKDICRVKLNCNDVCNPISACNALKYAERAVEAGYCKPEWISVDESLPEEYDIILCFNGSYVQSSVFLDGEFIEDDKYEGDPIRGVTHWMPFPQGPKGGAE